MDSLKSNASPDVPNLVRSTSASNKTHAQSTKPRPRSAQRSKDTNSEIDPSPSSGLSRTLKARGRSPLNHSSNEVNIGADSKIVSEESVNNSKTKENLLSKRPSFRYGGTGLSRSVSPKVLE
jgi:hypothetical protein